MRKKQRKWQQDKRKGRKGEGENETKRRRETDRQTDRAWGIGAEGGRVRGDM